MNALKRGKVFAAADTRDGIHAAATSGPTELAGRSELLGGVSFLEGTRTGWGLWELTAWFDEHLAVSGRMPRPPLVRESGVGAIALDPDATLAATAAAPELPNLIAFARDRVVATLSALIGIPSDDRFLNAAIFAGRVARRGAGRATVWTAKPTERDRLSDIVLSLFAADLLSHRAFHEVNLCVCATCGRVSFAPDVVTRAACREHGPRGGESGFFRRCDDAGPG